MTEGTVPTVRAEIKKYGKVGEKWIATDGPGFMVGLIIGKYFDGKNGLTY
jgi:hypothetical protein